VGCVPECSRCESPWNPSLLCCVCVSERRTMALLVRPEGHASRSRSFHTLTVWYTVVYWTSIQRSRPLVLSWFLLKIVFLIVGPCLACPPTEHPSGLLCHLLDPRGPRTNPPPREADLVMGGVRTPPQRGGHCSGGFMTPRPEEPMGLDGQGGWRASCYRSGPYRLSLAAWLRCYPRARPARLRHKGGADAERAGPPTRTTGWGCI